MADTEANPVAGSAWFPDNNKPDPDGAPAGSPALGVFSPRSEETFVTDAQQASSQFGLKEISMFSGVVLLINNITGPGVPQLPNMFAEAGWLAPTICLIAVWIMTTVSSSMYAEAMSNMPGNERFDKRYEYSTIVKYYFGQGWYIASQIGLNGALQSLNIISVIQSAQVMDNAISAIFGKSCGLSLTPFSNTCTTDPDDQGNTQSYTCPGSEDVWSCVDTSDIGNGNAWGCHVVLTFGFIVTAAMAIPAGRYNLDDNMIIQRVAFVLTVACWVIWLIAIFTAGTEPQEALPAINTNSQTGSIAGVVGNILFNFGFVTTVPSWINEKKDGVPVNRSLWWATTLCVIIYLVIGLPGAYVFADYLQGPVTATCPANVENSGFNCPNDLMQLYTQSQTAVWTDSSFLTFVLKSSVYLFPIVAVVSSIPVFSIVIKYNLQENGFSEKTGFLWGVVFPWAFAFPLLYMPDIMAQFVNFTSLLFVSFTDFIVPFTLYWVLQNRQEGRKSGLLNHDLSEIEPHNAFPKSCTTLRESPYAKKMLSLVLGCTLTVLSIIGTYLTIDQGSYELDATVCANVGN